MLSVCGNLCVSYTTKLLSMKLRGFKALCGLIFLGMIWPDISGNVFIWQKLHKHNQTLLFNGPVFLLSSARDDVHLIDLVIWKYPSS